MRKLIGKLLPLHDQLYIYQNLEYQPGDFIRWCASNFWRRNIQQKHRLNLTSKAILLLGLTYLLLAIESSLMTAGIGVWWSWPFWFVIFEQFSPIFILIAQLILWPVEAYQRSRVVAEAKEKRSKLKDLRVVAIAGSFAKTSIKDMLYTLLWKDFFTVKTPKSYNTELSIAQTIIDQLKPTTEVFLCEMDAYHPGDIRRLCQLAQPEMGMITAIAPQHLERFGSMDKLALAQFEVEQSLPERGVVFLNAMDERTNKLSEIVTHRAVWFGGEGEVSATHIKQTIDGVEFKIHSGKNTEQVKLPLFGEHHVTNFCAAAAVSLQLGMSLKKIAARASLILPTPHRLEVRKQGNLTIIDNTYNTNPVASQAALALLKSYPGSQKILITPGLVELGKSADDENRALGETAANVADRVIVVGQNAKRAILTGLGKANYPKEQILVVKSTNQALLEMARMAKPGAVVLLENDLPDQYQ